MSLAIDELISPPTQAQVLDTFLSELEALGIKARSWRVGGVGRTILQVVAKTYAGFASLMAQAIRSGFLETAAGDWLTLLARNVFGVDRLEATFAAGQVQLVNSGGGIYSFVPGQLRVLWLAPNKAYTNTTSFTLNPGDTLLVDVEAVELGAASSAAPGAITGFETTYAGVTVTNPLAVVGIDAEVDADLRARCRAKLGTLSPRGPRDAYAYAVSSALRDDGTPVDINRSSISPSSSTGTVTVTVASPSGAPSSTDLDFVRASIEALARPDSVTVVVQAATANTFTRNLVVWARRTDGLAAGDLVTLAYAAITVAMASYPIGGIPKPPATQGYFYAEYLGSIVNAAHPAIYDVDGIGADVALAPADIATLTCTVDVRIVDVP